MKKSKIKYIVIPSLLASIAIQTNHVKAEDTAAETPSTVIANQPSTEETTSPLLSADEYKKKSGLELAELIKNKKVTSEHLVNLAYEIIEQENPNLNAVITQRKEEALEEARNFDKMNLAGNAASEPNVKPFSGVPILLKGLGHIYKGADHSNGSLMSKGDVSRRDSSISKEFKELGFIILGQTNYPEYGFRNITDSKLFGTSNNPWDINRNSGGSSGGSASAVASGMTPIASGSDAGGSIRIPSSWTGLIGLKPSRAMMDKGKKDSHNTTVNFPITKSIDDAKAILDSLSTKKDELVKVDDIKKLKIGYSVKSPMNTEVSEDAKNAVLESVAFLREQGFDVEEVDNPLDGRDVMRSYTYGNLGYPLGLMSDKQVNKAFQKHNITKFDLDPLTWAFGRTKAKDVNVTMNFGENVKRYEETMKKFHEKYPIFLTPTNAVPAPLNSDKYVDDDIKEKLYNIENIAKEEKFDLLVKQWEPMLRKTPFTQISNLTGEPTLSLPTYLTKDNLPMGIMLNGSWGMDEVLLKFGKLFEDNNKFKMFNAIQDQAVASGMYKTSTTPFGTKFAYDTSTPLVAEDLPAFEFKIPDTAPTSEDLPKFEFKIPDTAPTSEDLPKFEFKVPNVAPIAKELPTLELNKSNIVTTKNLEEKNTKKLPNTGVQTKNSILLIATLALSSLLLRKKYKK